MGEILGQQGHLIQVELLTVRALAAVYVTVQQIN